MDFSNSQDAIIALAGTIFGGAGLEIIRRGLSKSKEREDSATAMRQELRTELTGLKTEMTAVEKELDMWRQRYYELFENYLKVKFQYEAVASQLKANGLPVPDVILPATPLAIPPTLDKTVEGPVDSDQK